MFVISQPQRTNYQTTFITLEREVADAKNTITSLQTTLQTAQDEDIHTHSILATKEAELAEAKILISTLHKELELALHDARHTQSSLDTLHGSVLEANKKWMPGIVAFKQWMSDHSNANITLPMFDDSLSSSSTGRYNVLAHKALQGIHCGSWSSAYEDSKQSIDIQPSAMGYITKSLAHIGQGNIEEALQIFDLAFGYCDPNESNLLLLIKAIIIFVAGRHDEAICRIHHLAAIVRDEKTMSCYMQVLGNMYLMEGDHEGAVSSLRHVQGFNLSCPNPDLEAISLIFKWNFDNLWLVVQQHHCEVLLSANHVEEATQALLKILETFGEEIWKSKETAEWFTDLRKKCVGQMDALGDVAFSSGEFAEAIACYSSAVSLSPPNKIDLLVKRSKAQAARKLWGASLADANKVIELDPLSHRGYERKYVALHGAEDYGGANHAILHMLSIMENSPDEETRRLQEKYTSPHDTIAAIDRTIHEIFKLCPLVLIDVTTGRLCDAKERIRIFKSEKPFKKIISEAATKKIDDTRILKAVAKYFEWVMFSHTWEGKEPTFQDVNLVDSVWQLDTELPLNEKLCQFCTMARNDSHRWAWSDTCCINKETEAILNRSLTSMYSWYEEAAATLVYLADVLSLSELGDLTKSRWMTRAWTLQELLASKVVRFYSREWKPYLNDMSTNHLESPAIKEELARAMGISAETISSFRPERLGVREKLRLASTRSATVEEDAAYSLIGIFSSDIAPRYGLGKAALGQLLENVVARSGDVTVIAWTGKSSLYNSALPASLTVYSQNPYSQPPMDDGELGMWIEELRPRLQQEGVLQFYYQVIQLPRATFSNRCLQLPCIAFSVTKIGIQELDNDKGNLYRASVSLLGLVEFRTADIVSLKKPRKLTLINPWLSDLTDIHDGFISDDESEVESNVSADDEPGVESDVGESGNSSHHTSTATSPLHAEPSARMNALSLALRLIVRLGHPFNALLLEQQPNKQYKRIATEHEIIIPGVPYQTNPKDIRVKVLEIV